MDERKRTMRSPKPRLLSAALAALKAETASSKPRAEEMSSEVVVAEVTEIQSHGNGNGDGKSEGGEDGGEGAEPVATMKSGASVLRKKKGGKRSR